MYYFDSDYMEGAHEKIVAALVDTNMEKTVGYGEDSYSKRAKDKIKKACKCPNAEVFFAVGGTQTNALVVKSLLRSYEGVLAPDTGHISVHEAGAIENTGHKVMELPMKMGKISADQVRKAAIAYQEDPSKLHTVRPGMVYISQPSEYGTLYSKDELSELRKVCDEFEMYLFMDGARLGYGLVSSQTDVTLSDIAALTDVFYIGGTKVGAFFGEAIVFTKPQMVRDFFSIMKQEGSVLAKGRMLGIQFDVLFTDSLYQSIASNAVKAAEKLKDGFMDRELQLCYDSYTNQQFVILDEEEYKKLSKIASFGFWEKLDEHRNVYRFVTSWATKEEDIDSFFKELDANM